LGVTGSARELRPLVGTGRLDNDVALAAAVVALRHPYLIRHLTPSEWMAAKPTRTLKEEQVNSSLDRSGAARVAFFGAGYDQRFSTTTRSGEWPGLPL